MRTTNTLKRAAEDYLKGVSKALAGIDPESIEKIASIIVRAYREGNKIILMGNGGSAATASHFACDLAKGAAFKGKKKLKAVCLCDNVSVITAYANDCGYSDIFSRQLENILEPGDVVMALSASGNSENVLRAVKVARKHAAVTVGLTGYKGGKLKGLVCECLVVPSNDMEQIEDVHLVIVHTLKKVLIKHIRGRR